MPNTANYGWPTPSGGQVPNVPSDMLALANAQDASLFAVAGTVAAPGAPVRFASGSARDSAITAPVDGMVCVVDGVLQIYVAGAWDRVWRSGFTPTAVACGEVVVPITNSTGSANVTFPSGRFTLAPVITGLVLSTANDKKTALRVKPGSITTTGFTVEANTTVTIASGNATVTWEATQMTLTSATG